MNKEPKIKIDADTGLIEREFEEDESVELEKMLWGKNPFRAAALSELFYAPMCAMVDEGVEGDDFDAKRQMTCVMTANSVLDIIMEAVPDDLAAEITFYLDHFIGLNLTNKEYDVDIMEELGKALSQVNREECKDDEEYERRVADIEEHWWTVSQPALGRKNAADAIFETMKKHNLV